jgi:hypothetical protein
MGAREFGRRLMAETSFVMVTGGLVSKGPGKLEALDGILVRAAAQALEGSSGSPQERIITMTPGIAAS